MNRERSQETFTLFVDNIPEYHDQTWLKRTFNKLGEVKDAFIPRKRSKRSGKNFGFVRYNCHAATTLAISRMNGVWVENERLFVKEASFGFSKEMPRPKQFRPPFLEKNGFTQEANLAQEGVVALDNDIGPIIPSKYENRLGPLLAPPPLFAGCEEAPVGSSTRFSIDSSVEQFSSVSLTYKDHGGNVVLSSLYFDTNLEKYGPFGKGGGQSVSIPIEDGVITGFHGRGGYYVDAIGIFVAPKLKEDEEEMRKQLLEGLIKQRAQEVLETKIKELKEREDVLQTKMEEVEAQNKELRERIKVMEVTQMIDEELKTKNEELKTKTKELKEREDVFQTKMEEVEAQNKELRERIKVMEVTQKMEEELKTKIEELKTKNKELKEREDVYQTKMEEVEVQNKEQRERIKMMEGTQKMEEEVKTKIEELETINKELKERDDVLQTKMKEVEAQNKVLREGIKVMERT
ncbi:hypothetical protein RHGRI_033481 [Rhododendron griersonianum]|uniref:RRM domain-containing protein n=1 Tax=Rhododendron griersonianum TaxID=479676 RepID=A0AAV6I018_9ERIC|nr:hypothetical protein RHGRI_033481 [Rhododendron griersonianum]